MIKFNDSVRDRFLRYTTYDTMSDGNACGKKRPTTDGQEELLLVLKKELEELGLETYYGEEKVVMGVLKGNTEGTTIGFMAHVDTADDCNGTIDLEAISELIESKLAPLLSQKGRR